MIEKGYTLSMSTKHMYVRCAPHTGPHKHIDDMHIHFTYEWGTGRVRVRGKEKHKR